MNEKDTLFDNNREVASGSFEFNESVVRVFPDMIERSVPGYKTLLELTPLVVKRAVLPNSNVYDLGCSLGAATLAARRAIHVPNVRIIGVDNAPDMVERCRALVAQDNSNVPVDIVLGDVIHHNYEDASLFLMYFTLQFVAPKERLGLLQKIHRALTPGGALLLAEKLCFDEADGQTWMDEHHLDFKRSQGYSDLEIANKRQAIENVLVPQTQTSHEEALALAGFRQTRLWFQCLNFAAFVAIK
jgi:tRNA (cmo5U34)-methyltransferase